jgi:HlyD family secretion protein
MNASHPFLHGLVRTIADAGAINATAETARHFKMPGGFGMPINHKAHEGHEKNSTGLTFVSMVSAVMAQRGPYLIVLLSLAMLALLISTRVNRAPAAQVATAQVTTGAITRRIVASGVLQPAKMVEAGAQVSGTIQTLAVDFNSKVRAGQILAQIDPLLYEAQMKEAQGKLAQAQAELARAMSAVDDAATKLSRAEALAAASLISRADLDAANIAMQRATADRHAREADIAAARAALNQAQVQRDHTTIRSPIDGVVMGRFVDRGQTVVASLQAPPLFRIGDVRRMNVVADISEADVPALHPGTGVTLRFESIAATFQGTVSQVRLQPMSAQGASALISSPSQTTPSAVSPPPAGAIASTSATAAPGAAGSTVQSIAPTVTPSATVSGTAPSNSSGNASTAAPASAGQAAASSTPAPSGSSVAPSSLAGASSVAPAGGSSGTAPSGSGVVTYQAIIEVENRAESLAPGRTVVITLSSLQREHVVRIPNNALTFRPRMELLSAAALEQFRAAAGTTLSGRAERDGRVGYVWQWDGRQLIPIEVRAWMADENWTELVSGGVRPGDHLVTNATSND